MENDEYLLAFDVGTTAVKGAVYTTRGKCLFTESMAYPKHFCHPGWVEQSPSDWMHCIVSIINHAKEIVDFNQVSGVGVVSQVNTHVFVDKDGQALRDAIVWEDQRCAEVTDMLNQRIEEESVAMSPLDSSSLVCRAKWLKKFEPDIWEKTYAILSPKDYCILQLTGEYVADGLTSIGLVDNLGRYLPEPLALIEGLKERLPAIKSITEIAGHVSDGWGVKAGCPVVTGTMDCWASLFGSGAFNVGEGFQVSGTSEILGLVSEKNLPSNGVVTFPVYEGRYLHAGPTQAGGDALKWFAEAQDKTVEELISQIDSQPSKHGSIIFLPYLMGERAPIWNPEARGAFIGLTKHHDIPSMVRAVMEGVGFSARHVLEHIEQAAGYNCKSILISGGASRSDLWCQMKANIMNCTLKRVENTDSGTFGAALMLATGIGIYQNLDEAAVNGVMIDRCFEPEESVRDFYESLYKVYLQSSRQLIPVYESLYKVVN